MRKKRRKEDYLRLPFIGREAEVIKSKDPGKQGIKGIVVDETKNTFTIRTAKKDVVIPKKGNRFKIWFDDAVLEVEGDIITQRPYDRIKKRYKKC